MWIRALCDPANGLETLTEQVVLVVVVIVVVGSEPLHLLLGTHYYSTTALLRPSRRWRGSATTPRHSVRCPTRCNALQPYAPEAAALCTKACNPVHQRLQSYAPEAATLCTRGCNRTCTGAMLDALLQENGCLRGGVAAMDAERLAEVSPPQHHPATHCLITPTAHRSPPTAHRPSPTAHHPRPTAHRQPPHCLTGLRWVRDGRQEVDRHNLQPQQAAPRYADL